MMNTVLLCLCFLWLRFMYAILGLAIRFRSIGRRVHSGSDRQSTHDTVGR